jgi:hypothetical protein
MDQSNFDMKSGAIKVSVDGSTSIDNLVGGAAASASAVLSTLAVPAGLFIAQKMVQKDLDQDQDNDLKGKSFSVALNVVDQAGKAVETMPQNLYDSLLTLLPNKKKTRKNKRNQANSNSTSKSKASKRKTRKN